ncbi:MAG: hypothetical protein OXK79_05035 [Chloroflexota bacterium]|nr:hypothetical protein [Chloroflexota bacterium]
MLLRDKPVARLQRNANTPRTVTLNTSVATLTGVSTDSDLSIAALRRDFGADRRRALGCLLSPPRAVRARRSRLGSTGGADSGSGDRCSGALNAHAEHGDVGHGIQLPSARTYSVPDCVRAVVARVRFRTGESCSSLLSPTRR